MVVEAFFEGIVCLHGFPTSIVSDRELVFTWHLCRDLFKMAAVKLKISTAFHPQTNGQFKVVNRTMGLAVVHYR